MSTSAVKRTLLALLLAATLTAVLQPPVVAGAAGASYIPPHAPQPQPATQCGTADPTWFQPNCAYTNTFADPSILRVDNDPNFDGGTAYYAFGTSTGGSILPVMWTRDPLAGPWVARPAYAQPTPTGDAYFNDGLLGPYGSGGTQPPGWVYLHPPNKAQWAANAIALPSGGYAVYFAAEDRDSHWCIGRALSTNPWGGYIADAQPMLCAPPDGSPKGIIDPQPFIAPDGTFVLIYKTQGVPGVGPSKIYAQKLSNDGSFAPSSQSVLLLQTDATWQLSNPATGAGSIENPYMFYAAGRYYLLYSGNEWTSADYGTGYATCVGPLGPCTDKTTLAPWFRNGSDARGAFWGAGGASVVAEPNGQLVVAFHAWDRPGAQAAGGRRLLHTAAFYVEPDGRLGFGDPVTNGKYVDAAYRDFLGVSPPASSRASWTSALGTGTTRFAFVSALASSAAWTSNIVDRFYHDTLGRPPDQAGLNYWSNLLSNHTLTVAQVAASFYSSDEYFANIGGGTNRSWVSDLYVKLLGRSADAGGLSYWTATTSSVGRVTVAYSFYQSLESGRARVGLLYQALLGRAPDAGGVAYWAPLVIRDGDLTLAAQLASSDEYFARAQVM